MNKPQKNNNNNEFENENITPEIDRALRKEIYKTLYPAIYNEIKDYENMHERVLRLYNINRIDNIKSKDIKTIKQTITTLDELDDIEHNVKYTPIYDELKDKIEEKKEEVKKTSQKKLTNKILKKLYFLSDKENKQKFYKEKTKIEEDIEKACKRGIDFEDYFKRVEKLETIVNKPKQEIYEEYMQNIFREAQKLMGKGEYKQGLHLISFVEDHFKQKNEKKYLQITRYVKNQIISSYTSLHHTQAFKYAQDAKKDMMNKHLAIAQSLMKRGQIKNDETPTTIQNTCYRELMHWSVKQLQKTLPENKENRDYINLLIEHFNEHKNLLENNAQGSYDLERVVKLEKDLEKTLNANNYKRPYIKNK